MNRKEIYAKVRRHLLRQKRRSVDANGFCLYRGPDNLKCAIGCLIPDDKYSPAMESNTASSLLNKGYRLGFRQRDANFLDKLQSIHDGRLPEDWKAALDEVKKDYSL